MCSKGRSCLRGFVSLHQGVPLPKTETRIKHKKIHPKVQRYPSHTTFFYLVVLVHINIINRASCHHYRGLDIPFLGRMPGKKIQSASIRIYLTAWYLLSVNLDRSRGWQGEKSDHASFHPSSSPSLSFLSSSPAFFCASLLQRHHLYPPSAYPYTYTLADTTSDNPYLGITHG